MMQQMLSSRNTRTLSLNNERKTDGCTQFAALIQTDGGNPEEL